MSEKKEGLKPEYSVNLETLIAEVGITKKALAEKIHTSPQTISKACNGIRLTQSMAESIIELYPKYNVGWLLGYTKVKFKADSAKAILRDHERSVNSWNVQETVFDTITRLARDVGFEAYFNGSLMTVEPTAELAEEGYKTVVLSFSNSKMLELQEDVAAFIKYKFQTIVKRNQEGEY